MNRRRSAIRIATWILVASLVPLASARAFIYLKGSTYEKGERPVADAPVWPGRKLRFVVNTDVAVMGGSLATPVTGAELLEAAREAAAAWGAACRADLVVEVAGTTAGTFDANDGANVIQWDNRTTAEGNYYGASTSTLAAATTVLHGTDFVDCDIVLNGNSTTTMKFSPAAGQGDLRSVLTHEFGHCLGLDHPIEPPDYTSTDPFITEATMVQTAATGLDPSDSGRRDIAQDDRDGVECIYERGKPLRNGLHCGSYSGTNGQGALSGVVAGGPTAVDTGCGGDAQGRNATVSLDTGDGCVTSAIAGTAGRGGVEGAGRSSGSGHGSAPWCALGGSFGFLLAIAALLAYRVFRRRSLRRAVLIVLFAFGPFAVPAARAIDVELSYGARKVSPDVWNAFAGMDPNATAWDRAPTNGKLGSIDEIRATAFSEFTAWGKWGGALSVMLPKTLESNGKATNAADQSKRTTLSGFRVGPDFRWFPAGEENSLRWFVGGRLGIGLFFGSQTFANPSASSVSYRAWQAELAVSTGAEIPLGPLSLVVEGGYSFNRSSYFASTGSSGSGYSDFPSGTRIATNTGAGTEDVRFGGSGPFATIGLQMRFGSTSASRSETPAYDDYESAATKPSESSESTERTEDRTTERAAEETKTRTDESLDSNAPKSGTPTPATTPAPVAVPTPAASPLADPLEEERKFRESLRPKPDEVPSVTPTAAPATSMDLNAPRGIDPIPGMEGAKSPDGPTSRPDQPDPVPGAP